MKVELLSPSAAHLIGFAKNKLQALGAVRKSVGGALMKKTIYVGDFKVYMESADWGDLIRLSGGGGGTVVAILSWGSGQNKQSKADFYLDVEKRSQTKTAKEPKEVMLPDLRVPGLSAYQLLPSIRGFFEDDLWKTHLLWSSADLGAAYYTQKVLPKAVKVESPDRNKSASWGGQINIADLYTTRGEVGPPYTIWPDTWKSLFDFASRGYPGVNYRRDDYLTADGDPSGFRYHINIGAARDRKTGDPTGILYSHFPRLLKSFAEGRSRYLIGRDDPFFEGWEPRTEYVEDSRSARQITTTAHVLAQKDYAYELVMGADHITPPSGNLFVRPRYMDIEVYDNRSGQLLAEHGTYDLSHIVGFDAGWSTATVNIANQVGFSSVFSTMNDYPNYFALVISGVSRMQIRRTLSGVSEGKIIADLDLSGWADGPGAFTANTNTYLDSIGVGVIPEKPDAFGEIFIGRFVTNIAAFLFKLVVADGEYHSFEGVSVDGYPVSVHTVMNGYALLGTIDGALMKLLMLNTKTLNYQVIGEYVMADYPGLSIQAEFGKRFM